MTGPILASRLRRILFATVYSVWIGFCCLGLLIVLAMPERVYLYFLTWFFRSLAWIERVVLGLSYHVEGLENLPRHGAYIVAAKHHSAWETLKLFVMLRNPAIVAKRELFALPFWGWYMRRSGAIPIDRGQGARTVARLIASARAATQAQRPIVIFPEGTRTLPGQHRRYQVGVILLAQRLKLPIVPMAHNAGLFWPRRGMPHSRGTITVRFLPALTPQDDAASLMRSLEECLEEQCNAILPKSPGAPDCV
ncbi:MAG: 1-acyl-sn-glycerol-3-phosphate acyltransferase [Alphaproteobacteria bacterium]|nr:MAG: 1-acyl-sn-glycerol-3-phosphate acyltransferase [Alphaproteobacteria bacterium]